MDKEKKPDVIMELVQSGYAGILPNGNIVDCREYAEAIPMKKNSLLGIPKSKVKELPNEINLKKLSRLLMYSDRYEINIQFWPDQIAVYIAKDDVDLTDFGGGFDFAVNKAIEYLDRINRKH